MLASILYPKIQYVRRKNQNRQNKKQKIHDLNLNTHDEKVRNTRVRWLDMFKE